MARKLACFAGNKSVPLILKLSIFLWYYIFSHLFESRLTPLKCRIFLIRIFGGKIGVGVKIKSRIRVHFPWNLEIGDNCWIGEEVWFINHEKITIGSDVCISQRSIICSGGHDYRSKSLEFAHKSIEIMNGAWVCLDAKVLPGVTIGECSVISAGEVVRKSVPKFSMLLGGHIRPIEPPK